MAFASDRLRGRKMEIVKDKAKNAEYEKRARSLVAQMTLEEKAFQMVNSAPAIERLGIKAYNWWNEALHGVARAGTATVFPQAISLAATFDEDFIEQVAEAVSTEGRAKFNAQQKFEDFDIYKGLTFWSPNVNIFRDPRWGRGHETFGEDPYLTSRLGVRFVEGLQGHDENYLKTAACAKHFAVHSGPEDLRHEFNAVVSIQDMYETYLPAFKACVQEAGVEAVMGAYNRTNDEPCCGSKTLLQDILREEWGFQGHVVSDCWAIRDFHGGHGVTAGPEESVAMAVNHGCDLNCGELFLYVADAVRKGMIPEARVDEALVRLFMTRIKLGLLGDKEKTPYDDIPYTAVDSRQMQELNLRAAEKCIVLLKNENDLLPLDKSAIGAIGVIGPNANNRKALVGNYEGTASRYYTIAEGIQEYAGEDVRVLVSEGCHLYREQISNLSRGKDRDSEVKAVCEASDVVIMCLGLDAGLEGEEGDQGNQYASGDKPNLHLPGRQQEILEIACASGKPVVLVLLSGSALAVGWADEHVPAIVQGWYPGAQGGRAVARVLFGDKNPEGRLPVTFYRTTEELPAFTDYSMQGRTYRYMQTEALYPFGYGLSYTTFAYTDVALSSPVVGEEGITVKAVVTNMGSRDGAETVQVYVKAVREATPNAQLKAIRKLSLQAGQSQEITIALPASAFALYDTQGINRVEAGNYHVFVGGAQPDGRSEALTGQKIPPLSVEVRESFVI